MMPQAMDYPLEYILGTTIFGAPLYWGCVSKLSPERKAAMKEFYRNIALLRKKFFGNINLPVGDFPQKGSWSGVLSISTDEKEFYLAVYRHGADANTYKFDLPFACEPEIVCGNAQIDSNGVVTLPDDYAFALFHGVK